MYAPHTRDHLVLRTPSSWEMVLFVGLVVFCGGFEVCAADLDKSQFEGNPPICPRWAFEPWVWEDNGNTRKHLEGMIEGYKKRDIPVGAVIVDSPWETSYNSFEWDTKRYPKPQEMIDKLRAGGVRVVMWITGALNSQSKDTPENKAPGYDEVVAKGLVVDGGKEVKWWKGKGVHIDFTNPKACQWYGEQLDKVMEMGIDGWKVDQAENYLGKTVETSIGTIKKSEFKPYYYAQVQQQALAHNPESLIIARPYSHQGGYAASINRCTVGWGGDYEGNFGGIRKQMKDLYRSASTGYGTLAVEVGGFFRSHPSKKSLIRYAQFGALMPVMVNGGENGGLAEHLPWHWDDETVKIYLYYATLHSELAPYLFSCSVDTHLNGGSIVKDADYDKGRHMLGEWLLVYPVWTEEGKREVELPGKGKWIDYWNDGSGIIGGTKAVMEVPLDRIPIYIKPGAIIPMKVTNGVCGHGDESSAGFDTIMVYPSGKSSYTYHRPRGMGIEYDDVEISVDEGTGIGKDPATIKVDGDKSVVYRFRVKSFFDKPTAVKGADSWRYDEDAKVLYVDKKGAAFEIVVEGLRWL